MEQETKTYFLKNCISFGNENMTKKEEMEIKKGLKNIINNYELLLNNCDSSNYDMILSSMLKEIDSSNL